MPETNDALYSRGKYRLEWDRRRDGTLRTPHYQVVWYDEAAKRNRSRSTGTGDVRAAEKALDRLFLERERGETLCPTCHRPMEKAEGHLVTLAISDYLVAREDRASFGSLRARLAHVLDFLDDTKRTDSLICEKVDDDLITEFRRWSVEQLVHVGNDGPKSRVSVRSPGTTEASVVTLAAAINLAHKRKDAKHPAGFTALPPSEVSRTPTYRATIAELAAMFRYCVDPRLPNNVMVSDAWRKRYRLYRLNLLRFLQGSVATWARPDAVHDISTDPARDQWISNARVLQLNPKGRRQTTKHRPAVPIPHQFAKLLDGVDGFFIPVDNCRKAFEAMLDELGLPRDRETGLKLIRRSMASIARKRIGEERWTQGEMMLGHKKASTSDLYALFDPANLGLALQVTEGIIDEIVAIVPGAFSAYYTGTAPELKMVEGGKTS